MADKQISVIVRMIYDEVKRGSSDVVNSLKTMETAAQGFGQTWDKVTSFIGSALWAGGFSAAALGVVNLLKECAAEARESEKSMVLFEQTMKNTGRFTYETSDQLKRLAQALASTTDFTDDAILSASRFLITHEKIASDLLPRAIQLTVNLAAAMGGGPGSLEQAAQAVGRAAEGQTRAFRTFGVELDKASIAQRGFISVLEQAEPKFSGLAEQVRLATGGFDAFWKEVKESKEAIGNLMAVNSTPWWNEMAQWINEVNASLNQHVELLKQERLLVSTGFLKPSVGRSHTPEEIGTAQEQADKAWAEGRKDAIDEVNRYLIASGRDAYSKDTANREAEAIKQKALEIQYEVSTSEERDKLAAKRISDEAKELKKLDDQWLAYESKHTQGLEEALASEQGLWDDYYKEIEKEAGELSREQQRDMAATVQATDAMYRDLGKSAEDWYDYQVELLNQRKENYEQVTDDQLLIDRWYEEELRKLWEERVEKSGTVTERLKLDWENYNRDVIESNKIMYDIIQAGAEEFQRGVSDAIFDTLIGEMDSFSEAMKSIWDSMWKAMLKTAIDYAVQIVTKALLDELAAGLAGLLGGGGALGGLGGLIGKIFGAGAAGAAGKAGAGGLGALGAGATGGLGAGAAGGAAAGGLGGLGGLGAGATGGLGAGAAGGAEVGGLGAGAGAGGWGTAAAWAALPLAIALPIFNGQSLWKQAEGLLERFVPGMGSNQPRRTADQIDTEIISKFLRDSNLSLKDVQVATMAAGGFARGATGESIARIGMFVQSLRDRGMSDNEIRQLWGYYVSNPTLSAQAAWKTKSWQELIPPSWPSPITYSVIETDQWGQSKWRTKTGSIQQAVNDLIINPLWGYGGEAIQQAAGQAISPMRGGFQTDYGLPRPGDKYLLHGGDPYLEETGPYYLQSGERIFSRTDNERLIDAINRISSNRGRMVIQLVLDSRVISTTLLKDADFVQGARRVLK